MAHRGLTWSKGFVLLLISVTLSFVAFFSKYMSFVPDKPIPYAAAFRGGLVLEKGRSALLGSRTFEGEECPPAGVRLPDSYQSLFYMADMRPYINRSLCGSPFNYLARYRSPCWIDRVPSDELVEKSRVKEAPITHVTESGIHWRLRCFPLVHLAGFSKSGTSGLYRFLKVHPLIIHGRKEPLFWSFGRFAGRRTLEQYLVNFDKNAEQARINTVLEDGQIWHPNVILDASSTKAYFMDGWRNVSEQENLDEPKFTTAMSIRALTPQAKIILILRNPTERTFSRYRMFCSSCSVEEFHQFVSQFVKEMKACLTQRTLRACAYNYSMCRSLSMNGTEQNCQFIRASLYVVYVKDWLDVFPRDQVYIVHSEMLLADKISAMKELWRFLGLDHSLITADGWQYLAKKDKINIGNLKGRLQDSMLNETRKLLDDFFKPYNRMLAQLLKDERFLWKPTN